MAKKKVNKQDSVSANPANRPKALLDLPEGWQDEILFEYSNGASDVEIKAMIYDWRGTFSNDLWDRWLKDEPDFSETIRKGRAKAQAWWMRAGRLHMMQPNKSDYTFSWVGWFMNMKNRYGWSDRRNEVPEEKTNEPIRIERTVITRQINEKSTGKGSKRPGSTNGPTADPD